mmetsp:Transcript_9677/g.15626  ORF Transcript_9677/g.15626 Transcript_9677/m.15626 type:complete len:80 (+) Transcript_9677:968-1207(+)
MIGLSTKIIPNGQFLLLEGANGCALVISTDKHHRQSEGGEQCASPIPRFMELSWMGLLIKIHAKFDIKTCLKRVHTPHK